MASNLGEKGMAPVVPGSSSGSAPKLGPQEI